MNEVNFQGIFFNIINPPLLPVSIEDLSEVESKLKFLFPEDYRNFITRFGIGETNLSIRTLSPLYISNNYLSKMRNRLSEYWFWNESPEILTQERAVQCVPFFDSWCGDDIIFHPSKPNKWFILPHEEEVIWSVNSFKQLCDLYSKRFDNLQPPFTFEAYK